MKERIDLDDKVEPEEKLEEVSVFSRRRIRSVLRWRGSKWTIDIDV